MTIFDSVENGLCYYEYMSTPDFQLAEKKAKEIIAKYGITVPFVDVASIAMEEGLKLVEFDPANNEQLNAIAGFLNPETKTIYINKNDPANRKTYTIAHELGHYILKHKANEFGVLPRFQSYHSEKQGIEKEADAFAANLLVPKDLLKSIMRKYSLSNNDVGILAKMFAVSEEMMRYRLLRI